MKWFQLWWWRYLLKDLRKAYRDGELYPWQVIWCRIRNHPPGIVYYNVGGDEPDYTCKGCGDYLN